MWIDKEKKGKTKQKTFEHTHTQKKSLTFFTHKITMTRVDDLFDKTDNLISFPSPFSIIFSSAGQGPRVR